MKVRYHLQKGPNYQQWQFKDKSNVFYHDPKEKVIRISNCILHNNRRIANKIYLGNNKDVCAWIKFKTMEIMDFNFVVVSWATHIRYNPKVLPYWHVIKDNTAINLDGFAFDELYLTSKGIFYNSCRESVLNPFA